MPDVDIPNRVANFSSTGNNANSLAAQTVFTPSVAGLYRVSVYLATSLGSAAISATLKVSYSDAYGAESVSQSFNNVPPQMTVELYSAASVAIQVAVPNITTASGTVPFDIYCEVEQL